MDHKRERERENVAPRRDPTIDLLKATAIILVVIGHCIQYGSGQAYLCNGAYFDSIIFKIIYSFHMPLFMLISGYLFAFSASKGNFKSITTKKCKTILMPTLIWSLIMFAIRHFGDCLACLPLALMKEFMASSLVSFWFLWAVLILSLFVAFVRFYLNDSPAVYAVIFLASFLIPDYATTELFKFMFPYFIAGYFFGKAKKTNPEKYEELCKKLFGSSYVLIYIIAYVILIALYNYDSYIYTSGMFILRGNAIRQLGIDIFRFVIGFDGSLIVISAIRAVSGRVNSRTIQSIGMNTMGIYIISEFLNCYILPKLTAAVSGAGIITVVETVCITAICMVCIRIIKLSKKLDNLLLGGR